MKIEVKNMFRRSLLVFMIFCLFDIVQAQENVEIEQMHPEDFRIDQNNPKFDLRRQVRDNLTLIKQERPALQKVAAKWTLDHPYGNTFWWDEAVNFDDHVFRLRDPPS